LRVFRGKNRWNWEWIWGIMGNSEGFMGTSFFSENWNGSGLKEPLSEPFDHETLAISSIYASETVKR